MTKPTAIITPDTPSVSEPFEVPFGGQIRLSAQGLQGSDRVLVEIVDITTSGALPTECCPGPVSLPEVHATKVLRCRNGARVILTAQYPSIALDGPQGVLLRARLEADALSVVTVTKTEVREAGCDSCQCVEPYCASYPLASGGFAFIAGDEKDPEATVEISIPPHGLIGWIYPTPRIGATMPVYAEADCTTVVGFARNEGC